MTDQLSWNEIRQRLAASEKALDAAFTLDDAQAEEMMAARAKQLAARPKASRQITTTRSALIAHAGSERFALELSSLAGIVPFRSCTPLPGGPPGLLGIINARGELWAIFDFARLFCGARDGDGSEGYALLLRHPKRRVGLRFDTIGNVCEIDPSQLQAARNEGKDTLVEATEGSRTVSLLLVFPQTFWTHPAIREVI